MQTAPANSVHLMTLNAILNDTLKKFALKTAKYMERVVASGRQRNGTSGWADIEAVAEAERAASPSPDGGLPNPSRNAALLTESGIVQ
jgi:hypothetical protein